MGLCCIIHIIHTYEMTLDLRAYLECSKFLSLHLSVELPIVASVHFRHEPRQFCNLEAIPSHKQ